MSAKGSQANRKTVLIVDDHELMRQGLAQLIAQEPDLVVCGECEDAASAMKAIEKSRPDLAIVDITLKDSHGIELIKDIRARWPGLLVLVLSMHDELFYAERVLRAGARGYVTKAEASAKVVEAIRKVLGNGIYVSDAVASRVLCKMVGAKADTVSFALDALTDREFEVFELIGQGLESREIAERLHVSVKTVSTHREHIKQKLNLDSATELLMYAVQWAQIERGP